MTTVSGLLTTDGELPLVNGTSYNLVSFDTVLVNGVAPPFTTFFDSSLPPFTEFPLGRLDFESGVARIDRGGILRAFGAGVFANHVVLGTPPPGTVRTSLGFDLGPPPNPQPIVFEDFTPTANVFTPIPEPTGTLSCLLGVLILSFGRYRCR